MQDVVESNRQSISKLRPEEQEKICTICQCEMETLKIGTLECSHQFCFDCIKQWGTSCANTCPLCKKRFNQIKYKVISEETGQLIDKELKILNRNQTLPQSGNPILVQIDDSMDNCYICNSDRNPQLMMICDLCDYMVAHTYCCGLSDFPDDWICRDCEELMEIH